MSLYEKLLAEARAERLAGLRLRADFHWFWPRNATWR
jgi:hypothetical protein